MYKYLSFWCVFFTFRVMSLLTTYRCCNDATTESFLFLGYIDQVKQMSEKDDRLKIINEVLNGIKVKWHEIRRRQIRVWVFHFCTALLLTFAGITFIHAQSCIFIICSQVLKLYAWEESFLGKINSKRSRELKYLLKSRLLGAVLTLIFNTLPVMVSVFTDRSFVYRGIT